MPQMFKLKNITYFLLLSLFSSVSLGTELVIEHIANAGVKISSGNKTVLIDALFGPHKRFNSLSEKAFTQLTKQGADVALTTHRHSDHFGAKRTSNFLKHNPDTLFISTPQVLKKLAGKVASPQLRTESLAAFQSKLFSHHNVNVSVLNFPHGDPGVHAKTQNYAYLVDINGWKVLHIGDAGINVEQIEGLKLAKKNIDVALIHDRCLRQSDCEQRIKQMNVGKVAFIHMTDEQIKPVSTWIKKNLANATMLVTGYESVSLKK